MSSVDVYPEPQRYWNFLTATLSSVFGRPDADDLVALIRAEVKKAPCAEQLLFFHSEPFDVAATITQTKANRRLLSKYLSLARQLNWDSEETPATGGRWRRAR